MGKFSFFSLSRDAIWFPILTFLSNLQVAHQRRDLVNDGGEVYLPVYSSETIPDNEVLMKTFSK